MEKEVYLKKLSGAARWRLPYKEAEEVIADYRELLADSGGEDFGDPVQAVRLLQKPKEYRRWMAVFVLLAAIALAAPVGGLYNLPFDLGVILFLPVLEDLWGFFYQNEVLLTGLPLLGMVLGLLWLRGYGAKAAERPPLRRLLPMLAVQLLGVVVAWLVFRLLAVEEFSPGFLAWLNDHRWMIRAIGLSLTLGGPLCGALGVWGLARARMEDRRWLAVYIWGLTAVGLCTGVLGILHGMSTDISAAGWWLPYARLYAGLTAAGLLGTGWALC